MQLPPQLRNSLGAGGQPLPARPARLSMRLTEHLSSTVGISQTQALLEVIISDSS